MRPGFQEIPRCIVAANYSEDFHLNSIVSVLRPEDRLLITGRCKAVGNQEEKGKDQTGEETRGGKQMTFYQGHRLCFFTCFFRSLTFLRFFLLLFYDFAFFSSIFIPLSRFLSLSLFFVSFLCSFLWVFFPFNYLHLLSRFLCLSLFFLLLILWFFFPFTYLHSSSS